MLLAHQPEAFLNTWAAGYGEAILTVDRAESYMSDIDRNPQSGGNFLKKINMVRHADVPGMDKDGNCPIDFPFTIDPNLTVK